MTDLISKMSLEETRNLTPAERLQRFNAYKEALAAVEDTSAAADEVVLWNSIDDPMTLDQLDELPPGRPGIDTRTDLIWVKFLHPWHRLVMASTGRYDYDGGAWRGVLAPDDHWGTIKPIAWARIVPGQKPWDVPIVPDHVTEPS
jgi:hypothetical protein